MKSKIAMFLKWFFCMLGFLVVAACTPKKDNAWFIQSSCQAPCWFDIVPGETTSSELEAKITTNAFVLKDSLAHRGEYEGFSDVFLFDLINDSRVEIYLLGDRVSSIVFSRSLDLTINDIVTRYGEPDYVVFTTSLCSGPLFSEGACPIVYLIFVEQGIAVSFGEESASLGKPIPIQPETEFGYMEYFYPNDFEFIVDHGGFSTGHTSGDETRALFQPWIGYGDYTPQK